ncbi:head-tail adaptor protein [Shinella sp. CPCC 101442]|uniref:head-tail adaptor protein n=1 Tax=Shinella sp. CPCC 101442 TaxID=2932265 RepID=UPI0021524858|nr:head-tail adaptor protein [Shinella sp. CPCC 101442]MCR6498416.1 head-tail adaptor protein [Shinella sp. CPCC 101442]
MAKKPNSGALRVKLHFQVRPLVDDGRGNEQSGDWETKFTDFAELIPLRGGEPVLAARLTGVQPYIVRVRSHTASREVTPSWRAIDARNSRRELNIRSVSDPDQTNAWLDMMVDDGVAT